MAGKNRLALVYRQGERECVCVSERTPSDRVEWCETMKAMVEKRRELRKRWGMVRNVQLDGGEESVTKGNKEKKERKSCPPFAIHPWPSWFDPVPPNPLSMQPPSCSPHKQTYRQKTPCFFPVATFCKQTAEKQRNKAGYSIQKGELLIVRYDNKSTRYTCHAHNQKHPHLSCLRALHKPAKERLSSLRANSTRESWAFGLFL